MRRRAEAFARMRGYDYRSLIGMCSTVSRSLEIVYLEHGNCAITVAGRFVGEGHFWIELQDRTIVDLTATQFEWYESVLPKVLVTDYRSAIGQNYQVEA